MTPYLYYDDANSALNWMESVLGFTHAVRWRDESARVSEADIYAGSAMVSVSSGVPADPAGRGALLIVNVDNVDAEYERIREAGQVDVEPPVDQAYGPRTGANLP